MLKIGGAHDRPQLIVAGVLTAVAIVMTGQWIYRAESTACQARSVYVPLEPVIAGSSRNGVAKASLLDPRLRFAQLEATERKPYKGTGRNIFLVSVETPPKRDPPNPERKTPSRGIQQLSPSIELRFFGFVTELRFPQKVFLSKDGDVFVASEAEIVDRRYKILKIGLTSIDVEDMIEDHVYTLTRQPG